jgi:hypothetical protein
MIMKPITKPFYRRAFKIGLFSAAAFFFSSIPLFAEEGTVFERWPNALGVYGNSLAGNPGGGLHYQRSFGSLGLQFTGGGLYTPDSDWGSVLDYSVFIQGTWRVFAEDYSSVVSGQLYLWALGGHIGYIRTEYVEDGTTGSYEPEPYVPSALAGFGIGIELVLFRHFSLPLEFGYVGQFPNESALQFGAGAGFRYRY